MESADDEDHDVMEMQIEQSHKTMVTRFVLPNMSIVSALFFITYLSWDPIKLLTLGLTALVVIGNVYLTKKERIFRLGKHLISSRSDAFDCTRWIFNLLACDFWLMWVIRPDQGPLFAVWSMFILSAQADTFRRRYRMLVLAIALSLGTILFIRLYPGLNAMEHLIIIFGMVGISLVAGMTEQYWISSLRKHLSLQKEALATELLMSRLKTEATIGATTRTIIHELNNMITVLDASSRMDDEKARDRVRRAIAYIKKIHHLVTPGDLNGETRIYDVRQLIEDINLIISKYVTQNSIRWTTDVNPEAHSVKFHERSGAVYFIIHNLVKNACEALEAWHERHKDEARATPMTDEYIGEILFEAHINGPFLEFSVSDNGPGMNDAQVTSILNKSHHSSKSESRGLGLKFVMSECERNSFVIDIISHLNMGTRFTIRVPMETSLP